MDSLHSMVQNMAERIDPLKPSKTPVGAQIEKALTNSSELHLSQPKKMKNREPISRRGRKTCIFPCSDPNHYAAIVDNRERFKDDAVKTLPALQHFWGHRHGCKGKKGCRMKGFRRTPRKTIMKGGKQREFPIRMVQCIDCGEIFSVLPSFLPREKHFCMDIIGGDGSINLPFLSKHSRRL